MKSYTLFSLLLVALLINSCNPDCESVTGLRVLPNVSPETYQVLVTAQNPNSLKGKRVLFGNMEAESRFEKDIGLITTVPPGMGNGGVQIVVEDLDCETGLIDDGFEVINQNNYFNTRDFVSPSPPEFIIPVIPPSFPISIDNAWLSPQDVDYCVWFTSLKDTTNASGASPEDLPALSTLDPRASFEFSTCRSADPTVLYHNNPISGIVDKDLNIVEITIDRRPNGGGMESYTGQFIDINSTNYNSLSDYNQSCNGVAGDLEDTGHMILLTSRKSFRQTIIFQCGNCPI